MSHCLKTVSSRFRTFLTLCLACGCAFSTAFGFAEEPAAAKPVLQYAEIPATGAVEFSTTPQEKLVPARFQLQNHSFPYTAKVESQRGEVRVSKITFPSPMKTEIEENNTVHGMYFQPAGAGPFPAVVVLHILGGDFILSQTVANSLARKGVAALFIKMPYYGERRRAGHPRRMMSKHVPETVEGMTQAALDIRRAIAWLRARPEVDDEDLGITGISLGGLMSSLGAAAEPRIRKVGIQLAGGNLARSFWDNPNPEAGDLRRQWELDGGTRESFIKAIEPIEPTNYGHLLRGRHILMLAARKDEIFPESSTIALWKSAGEPEIIWLEDAGHYTSIFYIMRETERLGEFLKRPLKVHEAQAAEKKSGQKAQPATGATAP
ncbi:MAG: hypothetical protein JWM11_6543 [Planctomycetaceae bacterium]|nr:hypothetical protein [Planctomycetaceae bacterium]